MGEVFQGLSSKFLPNRQDKCLKRKDYQFPIAEDKPFQKHGSVCKDTFKIFLIMEWKNGYSCKAFYYGLYQKTHEHLDTTAEGSFLSLTLGKANALMEKISDNQSWSQDKGEEVVEEVNALSTKMDDLLHWLDQRAKYKGELKG